MRCGRYDFQLWNVAPKEANGWALLGEVRIVTAGFWARGRQWVAVDWLLTGC
jgi:hypothetical protein